MLYVQTESSAVGNSLRQSRKKSSQLQGSFSEGYISALHWSLTQFTPATNNISPVPWLLRFPEKEQEVLMVGVQFV